MAFTNMRISRNKTQIHSTLLAIVQRQLKSPHMKKNTQRQHEESGCTDYLQHPWEDCPMNTATGESNAPFDMPKLRKLVRQLNDEGWRSARAFYINGGKFNCARLRNGNLEIGMCQRNWQEVDTDTINKRA